ncbi:MAG: hypothetical protein PGMFKBFP_03119 [Anaerolineales bacterium]|nr:hypothetical protein [Anaerolineales bacterium]
MYTVTDTHPWVWFLTANSRLSLKAKSALSDSSNIIVIPSIVMMEIKYLYHRKRIPLSFEEVLQQVETAENILFHPMDLSIVSNAPTSFDIHDAIIIGTAIQSAEEYGQGVSLVTADRAITGSHLVPVIW